jgi:hypothetical protein
VDAPLQARLNFLKLRILYRTGVFYQAVAPALCFLAMFLFFALLVQSWRRRILPISALMIWLTLVLLLTHAAAFAFVDVVMFRVSSTEYNQYSYPLWLMVIGLILLDPVKAFRIGQGRKSGN